MTQVFCGVVCGTLCGAEVGVNDIELLTLLPYHFVNVLKDVMNVPYVLCDFTRFSLSLCHKFFIQVSFKDHLLCK